MMHGPASITVTGIAVPFGPNTWVIPTFLPNNPLSISFPLFFAVETSCIAILEHIIPGPRRSISCPFFDDVSLQLDFDVYACGQIQSCKGLNCFVGRLNNIYQALMCT